MPRFGLAGWLASEAGAVTVEWVVLAAAMAGLGITVCDSVRDGSRSLTTASVVPLAETRIAVEEALTPSVGTGGMASPGTVLLEP